MIFFKSQEYAELRFFRSGSCIRTFTIHFFPQIRMSGFTQRRDGYRRKFPVVRNMILLKKLIDSGILAGAIFACSSEVN